MSKRQTFYILLPFAMIFLYQNCSQRGFTESSAVGLKVTGIDQSYSPIDLSQESIQEVSFISHEPVLISEKGKNIMIMMDLQYKVDIQTREVFKFNPKNGTTQKHCLSEEAFQNLKASLDGTSVCKFLTEKSADQVCSQAITPAYASVVTSRDSLNLGYSPDSCGTNRLDACDEDPNHIKSWIQYFVANLNSQTCE